MKLAETQPSANRAPDVRICCKFCCKSQVQVNPLLTTGTKARQDMYESCDVEGCRSSPLLGWRPLTERQNDAERILHEHLQKKRNPQRPVSSLEDSITKLLTPELTGRRLAMLISDSPLNRRSGSAICSSNSMQSQCGVNCSIRWCMPRYAEQRHIAGRSGRWSS